MYDQQHKAYYSTEFFFVTSFNYTIPCFFVVRVSMDLVNDARVK